MTTTERQKRWRQRQAKQGRKPLTVTLPVELIEKLHSARQADRKTMSQFVENLLVAGLVKDAVINNGLKKHSSQPKDSAFLHLLNLVGTGTPIQDLKDDFIRMLGQLVKDGFGPGQIKKLLIESSVPTLSGKAKWTVAEVRGLLKQS